MGRRHLGAVLVIALWACGPAADGVAQSRQAPRVRPPATFARNPNQLTSYTGVVTAAIWVCADGKAMVDWRAPKEEFFHS